MHWVLILLIGAQLTTIDFNDHESCVRSGEKIKQFGSINIDYVCAEK